MVRADVDLQPEEIEAIITDYYGLKPFMIEKVRAIYRLDTPIGSFGFKGAEELNDLGHVAKCLLLIRQNGFRYIPCFLPTENEDFLINYKGINYFIEEWLEGEEVPKKSYPFLQKIGTALADFHKATLGIEFPFQSQRNEWGRRAAYLLDAYHRIQQWRKEWPQTETERQILDFLHYRCSLAYNYIRYVSYDMLWLRRPESAVLCHGGLHHKNIMIDNEKNIWFIDFETMVFAERVQDLAQLLQYHATPYEWDLNVVDRFLSAYCTEQRRPLVKEEWDIFFSYLAFPRRFYNRMCRYFENPERPEQFLLKLQETKDQDMSKESFLQLYIPNSPYNQFTSVFPYINQ